MCFAAGARGTAPAKGSGGIDARLSARGLWRRQHAIKPCRGQLRGLFDGAGFSEMRAGVGNVPPGLFGTDQRKRAFDHAAAGIGFADSDENRHGDCAQWAGTGKVETSRATQQRLQALIGAACRAHRGTADGARCGQHTRQTVERRLMVEPVERRFDTCGEQRGIEAHVGVARRFLVGDQIELEGSESGRLQRTSGACAKRARSQIVPAGMLNSV